MRRPGERVDELRHFRSGPRFSGSSVSRESRKGERKLANERNYCSRLLDEFHDLQIARAHFRGSSAYFRERSPEHESGCVTRENQRYLSLVVVVVV